jgi:hypothetical protein
MDAKPQEPGFQAESAHDLKRKLAEELAAARSGITEATRVLREAGDVSARVRRGLAVDLPEQLARHPLPWSAGLAAAGFLAARVLFRPRRKAAPVPAPSGGGVAKKLLLSSAGFLVKPVLKEVLLRTLRERVTPKPPGPRVPRPLARP